MSFSSIIRSKTYVFWSLKNIDIFDCTPLDVIRFKSPKGDNVFEVWTSLRLGYYKIKRSRGVYLFHSILSYMLQSETAGIPIYIYEFYTPYGLNSIANTRVLSSDHLLQEWYYHQVHNPWAISLSKIQKFLSNLKTAIYQEIITELKKTKDETLHHSINRIICIQNCLNLR